MKANHPLKTELATFRKHKAEIAELRQQLATVTAWRHEQERTADLNDKGALAEISRLQVICSLLPNRIAAREESFRQDDQKLLSAADSFVTQNLGPEIRKLLAETKARVKAELQTHLTNPYLLDEAVSNSDRVIEIKKLEVRVKVNPGPGEEISAYVESLIEAADLIESAQRKLLKVETTTA